MLTKCDPSVLAASAVIMGSQLYDFGFVFGFFSGRQAASAIFTGSAFSVISSVRLTPAIIAGSSFRNVTRI